MTTISLLNFLRESNVETKTAAPKILDYVSASRLNLWSKCPRAFLLRYVDGVVSPPSPALFVGKVVHGVLEQIYRNLKECTIVTKNDLQPLVDNIWSNAMVEEPCEFDDDTQEAKCQKQILDLVFAYRKEINISHEKPIAMEKRFEVPLVDPSTGEDLGLPLVGVIDLLLETQEGVVVVDCKTAASASYCELQHEIQLTAYAYLVRDIFGRAESSLEIRQLVKTKTPKIVTHRFEPRNSRHFRRFFDIVREYKGALDRGVFNCRPSWNCSMCEHKTLCAL